MGQINVKTEEMRSYASTIEGMISEWESDIETLYRHEAEIDAMWDGDASEAFKEVYEADRSKYDRLTEMLRTYKQAIMDAAQRYDETDEAVKYIVTKQ